MRHWFIEFGKVISIGLLGQVADETTYFNVGIMVFALFIFVFILLISALVYLKLQDKKDKKDE